ncbi:ATP-binding protein [Streptomyces gossypii]|uniref:ATP-binding protein n=1 Tax=Streptomyces gossypii TaxID=2883101 RepID=UPI0035CCD2D2
MSSLPLSRRIAQAALLTAAGAVGVIGAAGAAAAAPAAPVPDKAGLSHPDSPDVQQALGGTESKMSALTATDAVGQGQLANPLATGQLGPN